MPHNTAAQPTGGQQRAGYVIIEIALGIVLAVIILALLPTILGLGAVVVVVALASALIIGVGLFLWHNPDFLVGLGILAGGLAIL